jgi:hypothetical protein
VANYDPLLINETLPVKLREINSNGLVEVEEILEEPELSSL